MSIVVVLVAFAAVAGSVPAARSQVAIYPDGLPDGNYSGGIYLHVGTAKLDLNGLGALTTSTDEAGDARITMDSDEPSLSGAWAMEGSSDIGGTFSFDGVGGAEFPEDFGNGPTIGPGYTWSVSAYAVDGTILAISGDRLVSP